MHLLMDVALTEGGGLYLFRRHTLINERCITVNLVLLMEGRVLKRKRA